jgi:hypothetical protein
VLALPCHNVEHHQTSELYAGLIKQISTSRQLVVVYDGVVLVCTHKTVVARRFYLLTCLSLPAFELY